MVLFFFNDTATTEIYTLSLHDALPICGDRRALETLGEIRSTPTLRCKNRDRRRRDRGRYLRYRDRKSTRLNSSHANISYAVFCLKKKKKTRQPPTECKPKHPALSRSPS